MATRKPAPKKTSTARAKLKGDGVIAQGEGSIALGEEATYVKRDLIQKQIIVRGTDPASRALKTYLGELRAECTVLPIAAMGGDEEARGDVTLDQVFIEFDTTTPAPKRNRKQNDVQEEAAFFDYFLERDERHLSVLDVVLANKQVVRVLAENSASGRKLWMKRECGCRS
jgi:hypothetical protein